MTRRACTRACLHARRVIRGRWWASCRPAKNRTNPDIRPSISCKNFLVLNSNETADFCKEICLKCVFWLKQMFKSIPLDREIDPQSSLRRGQIFEKKFGFGWGRCPPDPRILAGGPLPPLGKLYICIGFLCIP